MTTTNMKPGSRIVLNATRQPGKWESEEFHGRHGTLLDFSRPHGYARVQFDGIDHVALVHPESLVAEVSP